MFVMTVSPVLADIAGVFHHTTTLRRSLLVNFPGACVERGVGGGQFVKIRKLGEPAQGHGLARRP